MIIYVHESGLLFKDEDCIDRWMLDNHAVCDTIFTAYDIPDNLGATGNSPIGWAELYRMRYSKKGLHHRGVACTLETLLNNVENLTPNITANMLLNYTGLPPDDQCQLCTDEEVKMYCILVIVHTKLLTHTSGTRMLDSLNELATLIRMDKLTFLASL